MGFGISVTSNIKADEIIGKVDSAITSVKISNAARNIMDPYVPYDEGIMAGSATAEVGAVVYSANYSKYPYTKNFNFRKDRHPKATNHWDKASIGENCTGPEGERFLNEAAAIIKSEVG